ncbi:nuclear transport factor 2 family protein [Burkholderia gladioli]|uniref:nuclear transport factor 2 family protein n=1 Tax=Burkholderia gladioli TaxID=28095 RepID=UPI001C5E9F5C|nr:hypothetical protein [Burkholderia gladioli]
MDHDVALPGEGARAAGSGRGVARAADGRVVELPDRAHRIRERGETVVSIGRFVGTHGTTGKTADAGYAHVWTVRSGRIARFRQYIDTKAVADARI